MPRPSTRPTGAVWRLLERWSDEHELNPTQKQMSKMFGVSDSLVGAWKFCDSLMQTDDIKLVSLKTGIDFADLAKAAAEDAPRALEAAAKRRGTSAGRQRRRELDAIGEENQDPGE